MVNPEASSTISPTATDARLTVPMNKEAQLPPGEYLLHAVKLIQERSLKRETIDWATVNTEITERAKTLTAIHEAQAAIKKLLKTLNDSHSFLLTSDETQSNASSHSAGWRLHWEEPIVIDVHPHSPAFQQDVQPGDRILEIRGQTISKENWSKHYSTALTAEIPIMLQKADGTTMPLFLSKGFSQTNPIPTARITAGHIGLLDLPGHSGDGALPGNSDYGDILRTAFRELEADGAQAWIIDLRRCDGGNMWPMLAGLTPLLGKGTYGSFVDPVDRIWWDWGFNGIELTSTRRDDPNENYPMQTVPEWQPLKRTDTPVVVLTSRVTSSSGEAVAISFIGHSNTHLIGEPTGGLTSANNLHELADGAWLLLAETYEADRQDRIYEAGIQPNDAVGIDWTVIGQHNDPAIAAAEAWLQTQLEMNNID